VNIKVDVTAQLHFCLYYGLSVSKIVFWCIEHENIGFANVNFLHMNSKKVYEHYLKRSMFFQAAEAAILPHCISCKLKNFSIEEMSPFCW